MWTKKEPSTTVAPVLTAKPVQIHREEAKEYLHLSEEIGLKTQTTNDLQVLLTLEELGVPIYPTEEIDKYFREQRISWSWYAVVQELNRWTFRGQIPLRVMRRMVQIRRRLPEAVFSVAAPGSASKDPFLGVSLGGSIFVIDHWDEPDFPFPIVP